MTVHPAGIVGLFLFAGLLYGLVRPDGALPRVLGRPSRPKVLALYGGALALVYAFAPDAPATATYRVTGTATEVVVNYMDSGVLHDLQTAPPWETTVPAPTGTLLSLVARNVTASGTVTAAILREGQLLNEVSTDSLGGMVNA